MKQQFKLLINHCVFWIQILVKVFYLLISASNWSYILITIQQELVTYLFLDNRYKWKNK